VRPTAVNVRTATERSRPSMKQRLLIKIPGLASLALLVASSKVW
jgi:hypothetical protein